MAKFTQFNTQKSLSLSFVFATFLMTACSFIELHPGARNIIFANDDSCELIKNFEAKVDTENMFIDRTNKAINEELQILAQNAAFENNANAIWPSSEVVEGSQSFKLLKCAK